ncbi:uncharacterized protein KY384_002270 [Bacidia gigantensis]|uniref:uncharacterized protein n=1 Tax=Bacidia gigantensis TaxID=2732470 RepID=UPI001D048FFF|nr:uncharacterized protein KY384_002270 [Bacidia gigantensis]KAG8533487.1 hypothetical protein KY384_002270 [Bacidia gigantensis]
MLTTRRLLPSIPPILILALSALTLTPTPSLASPLPSAPSTWVTLKDGRQVHFEPLEEMNPVADTVPADRAAEPMSLTQLRTHVPCLKGCIELFGTCAHLKSPALEKLVRCSAAACLTPPTSASTTPLRHENDQGTAWGVDDELITTTQSSTSPTRWHAHLGLSRLLAQWGGQCTKAGYFGLPANLDDVLKLGALGSYGEKGGESKGNMESVGKEGKEGLKKRGVELRDGQPIHQRDWLVNKDVTGEEVGEEEEEEEEREKDIARVEAVNLKPRTPTAVADGEDERGSTAEGQSLGAGNGYVVDSEANTTTTTTSSSNNKSTTQTDQSEDTPAENAGGGTILDIPATSNGAARSMDIPLGSWVVLAGLVVWMERSFVRWGIITHANAVLIVFGVLGWVLAVHDRALWVGVGMGTGTGG